MLSILAFKFNLCRYTVDSTNFDLLQQADVTPATELSAAVTGAGTALVQLAAGAYTRSGYSSTGSISGHIHNLSWVMRWTEELKLS